MSWAEKYRPESIKDIAGNWEKRKELMDWAQNWVSTSSPVIIHGDAGVGKTSIAYALANEFHWKLIELNASENRTKDIINKIAGEASRSKSLFDKNQNLIVLDEADNLHGTKNSGGTGAVHDVINNSDQPVLLIANFLYQLPRDIRDVCKIIEFEAISVTEIERVLKRICDEENIEYEDEAIHRIASNSEGDVRAAINDLQKNAVGESYLSNDMVSDSKRDVRAEIFPFLDELFQSDEVGKVREKAESLDMTPNEIIDWVDENMCKEYESTELADGYEQLAKSDKWLGRVQETQNYKYWKYSLDSMIAGVASAKEGTNSEWVRWHSPNYHSSDAVIDEISRKIASVSGCSSHIARREIVPLLRLMIHHCSPRDLTVRISARYDFDEREISRITGSGKDTKKVRSIVEDAQNMRQDFEIQKNIEDSHGVRNFTTNDSTEDDSEQELDNVDTSPSTENSDDNEEDATDSEQSDIEDFF